MRLLEEAQFRFLRFACSPQGQGVSRRGPREPKPLSAEFLGEHWMENAERKLRLLLGADWSDRVRGKSVVDFGCGDGRETVRIALAGATRVIGLDIEPAGLDTGRRFAAEAEVSHLCEFVTELPPGTRTDLVVTLDAFEHFADPEAMLRLFRRMLNPSGVVLVGFGPSWYHPHGSHVSPFPWSHLLLSEAAILRWRALYWPGHPRTFREAGVQRLSIKGFLRAVKNSGFAVQHFETRPIHPLRWLACRLTREFTTTSVFAILVPVDRAGS